MAGPGSIGPSASGGRTTGSTPWSVSHGLSGSQRRRSLSAGALCLGRPGVPELGVPVMPGVPPTGGDPWPIAGCDARPAPGRDPAVPLGAVPAPPPPIRPPSGLTRRGGLVRPGWPIPIPGAPPIRPPGGVARGELGGATCGRRVSLTPGFVLGPNPLRRGLVAGPLPVGRVGGKVGGIPMPGADVAGGVTPRTLGAGAVGSAVPTPPSIGPAPRTGSTACAADEVTGVAVVPEARRCS